MIRAVLFDLDDTLYPQATWLAGAWIAVATAGAENGAPFDELHGALCEVAAEGTDRGRIIDRALARCGRSDVAVAPLVDAFRTHAPAALDLFPHVRDELARLSALVAIGIVTDGDPRIQRAKLRALGLVADVVVCSDDDGRDHRKPDPLPFQRALDRLGLTAAEAVFVGDRPDKDTAGAIAVGMRAVRVRTGEYAAAPDEPLPWRTAPTAPDAMAMLRAEITGPAVHPAAASINP